MLAADAGRAPRTVYQTLDLLRGIAALAVVSRHLEGQMAGLLPSSNLAVDLFFVLSGFVIEHAYSARLQQALGVAGFMQLRVIRLYPLYLLGTAIGVGVVAAQVLFGPGADLRAAATSLVLGALFLPAWRWLSADHAHLYPFDFPAWSLFWELVINLFYAAIARMLGWRLLAVLLGLGAVMLVACAGWYGDLTGGANYTNAGSGGLRVVYSFFAGVAICRIRQAGVLRGLALPPLVAGAILIAIMALRPEPVATFELVAVLIGFPLLVLASTGEPGEQACRICSVFGRISYPVYVLHVPVLTAITALLVRGGERLQGIAPELGFVAGISVLALLAERGFDRPARRRLLRWWGVPWQVSRLTSVTESADRIS